MEISPILTDLNITIPLLLVKNIADITLLFFDFFSTLWSFFMYRTRFKSKGLICVRPELDRLAETRPKLTEVARIRQESVQN